jgi:hypothetical protein
MELITILKTIMLVQVFTVLLQATFAGVLIDGNAHGASLHELTARVLVILAVVQLLVALALRVRGQAPLWVPISSAGLVAAEVIEFAAGHFHLTALHVPLGVLIFGGVLRVLIWVMKEPAKEQPIRNAELEAGFSHR